MTILARSVECIGGGRNSGLIVAHAGRLVRVFLCVASSRIDHPTKLDLVPGELHFARRRLLRRKKESAAPNDGGQVGAKAV